MKSRGNRYVIFLAVLLIAGALLADVLILSRQNRQIFIDEENQLYHLANAIDNNIRSVLNSRKDALRIEQKTYYARREEQNWLRTGDETSFSRRLYEDLVSSSDITRAVLVMRGGSLRFSTDGRSDYSFEGFASDGVLRPCIDGDGNICLTVLSEPDEYDVRLAALIDLPAFYSHIISSELAEDNWVLLLDSGSQFMIHHQNYRVLADPIDAVTGATCGPGGIEMIKTIQGRGASAAGSYEYWNAKSKEEHVAYLYVLASLEADNGYFAIGVASQVDEKMARSRGSVVAYLISTVCFMTGVGIILWHARTAAVKEREHKKELEILREKNSQMQALIQKRSEIEHIDRLETIGTLTSSIAHEFNNLLTPIMAYSVMTLEKLPEDEEELCDYVEEIYNASAKARSIISRLSDLSRKNTENNFEHISVSDFIIKASESAMPAKPDNVSLRLELDKNSAMYGNELQLHQMMLNFILNAFQAMEESGGELLISNTEAGGEIVISVADSGPGVSKEHMPKIFDPFFTTKGSGKGTGLGLAICRQAAEDHHGRIALSSEPGKGCRFTVYLKKDAK